MSSGQWILLSDWFAGAGALLALLAGVVHYRAARRGSTSLDGLVGKLPVAAGFGAFLALSMAVWRRYIEVNHFPSQTMSEVLMMFSFALVVSLLALHFALGLHRKSPGWAILDDALVGLVLLGTLFTHVYTRGLSTAEKDLPPALQSYWFPPHLSSLIFSYATLGIAGLLCVIWFCARFWGGVLVGGRSKTSQFLILAALVLVPFLQVVTIPVLLLTGAVFLVMKLRGSLPDIEKLGGLEREYDEVSFRAFAVGMPFLTAGLFMGAFWAQEAWANYWGWDSKENSALITWLVYVVYIHLRMLGGYRGERAMGVLLGGAFSIFATFQLFGYLPDSQKSLHRYTDDNVVPREGMSGGSESAAAPIVLEGGRPTVEVRVD